MISAGQAMTIIQSHSELIRKNASLPAHGELLEAYNTFRQPTRAHLQALAGLGGLLPLMANDETVDDWLQRLVSEPFRDRYATIRKALLSNVWLQLPVQLRDMFIQEASEAKESVPAPARLVSVKSVVASRRIHIVTDDEKSEHVFLRAIEYGGGGGPLEIQSNVTGAVIESDPIGTLARATLSECGWKLVAGWWIVQVGGQRAEDGEAARHPRPLPRPVAETPQASNDETPEPSEMAPRPR